MEGKELAALARQLAPLVRGRVLVVSGSGISAESGVPTFRGAEGHWKKLDPTRLATMEAFERDPAEVWNWYGERRARIRGAQPNPAHVAIAQLSRSARDHLVLTQNVDDLHERGGTPGGRIVHIHGEIFLTRCLRCDFETRDPVRHSPLPRCERCGSMLRPGVVWFGEELDRKEIARVERFLAGGSCDIVLALGTTATFGYIVDWATRGGVLVEVNPEPTALSAHATHVVRGRAGEVLPLLLAE